MHAKCFLNTSCSTASNLLRASFIVYIFSFKPFFQMFFVNTIHHLFESESNQEKNNTTQTLGSCVLAPPYLWRETIAACSFSFSACVVPRTCQAWKNTMEMEGWTAGLSPWLQWGECIVEDHSTTQGKQAISTKAEESWFLSKRFVE